MMAGHTKSSSQEHSMFGFGQYLCKAYRCFASIRHPDKKHSSSHKHRIKFCDETCKEINEQKEARAASVDLFHRLRSHKGNEVLPYDDISNSPKHNNTTNQNTNKLKSSTSFYSRSSSLTSLPKKQSLFRNASHTMRSSTQTQTQAQTQRSFNRKNADTRKANDVGMFKKCKSSDKLDTKYLGRSGSMAHSGPLSRTLSQKESPEIMRSNLNKLAKLLTVQQSLECTLEELCFGCKKMITIPRHVIKNNGQIVKETETVSIKVKPGWTKGTKITFEGMKNEENGMHSCDVIFVITEKKHTVYRREGDDLEFAVRISLLQALTGCMILVPLLDGDQINLTTDEIIVPGYEKIIEGQGMPKLKERGQRGNLKLLFLVDFPIELTEDQKRELVTILQDSC